jgi:putative Mg2+ transporter-C (MgtC) family protein
MEWAAWTSDLEAFGRIALAMLLGGVIGFEREMANRPAGFRTHMLVCGIACMLIGLADPILDHARERGSGPLINADPIRIVEAIVAGVSFLGAGTIFRRGGTQVEGLTTAASLFAAAGIGIATGAKQYVLAIAVTILILLVLRAVLLVEKRAQAYGQGTRSHPPPGDDRTPRGKGESGKR